MLTYFNLVEERASLKYGHHTVIKGTFILRTLVFSNNRNVLHKKMRVLVIYHYGCIIHAAQVLF